MSPDEKIGFGKYKGTKWSDIDIGYLLWVEENHSDPKVTAIASYWIVERSKEADKIDKNKEYETLSIDPSSDTPPMMLDEVELEKLNVSEAALMVIAAFGDEQAILVANEIKALAKTEG